MASPQKAPRRWRDILRGALACGITLGLGSVSTLAAWSTGDSHSPGTVNSGQLDVVVNGNLTQLTNLDGTRSEAAWQIDDLMPGEVVPLTLTVSNTGAGTMPLDLRFGGYMTDLSSVVSLSIYEGGSPAGTVALASPTKYRQVGCSGGTLIASGAPGSSAASPNNYLSTKRQIAVGASVTYCIQLTMSDSAATFASTSLPDSKATLVFLLKGTQEGAP